MSPKDELASKHIADFKRRDHRDFYSVLDIPKDSNTDAIRQAYKKQSLLFHPDKNKHPEAKQCFLQIKTAFEHLSGTAGGEQTALERGRGKKTYRPHRPTHFSESTYGPYYTEEEIIAEVLQTFRNQQAYGNGYFWSGVHTNPFHPYSRTTFRSQSYYTPSLQENRISWILVGILVLLGLLAPSELVKVFY